MAFDRTLDKEITSREVLDDGNTRLTVAIYQYNGGVPKVQLKREIATRSEDGWKFAKLGRLTIDEVPAVAEGLKWAEEQLTAQGIT